MKKLLPIAFTAVMTLNFELGTLNCFAQTNQMSFTLEDRDRSIRMEERMNSLQQQIGAINDKIDKLYTLIYFVLGGVFGLFGFIMWDRRSYIKPVKDK